MSYIITDNNHFIGKGSKGRPTIVTLRENAFEFKNIVSAKNFLACLPTGMKIYDWEVNELNEEIDFCKGKDLIMISDVKQFGNPTKTTILEDPNFDICDFFTRTIQVMSQIDRFIANMLSNEQIIDMKILDVRHYLRDNDHRLNAIQMQRLGYYLQDLERERYEYKSKRLIASMFANNIEGLKDKNNIDKMNKVVTSKYHPRILEDSEIECIINKKKDISCIS